MTVISSPGMMVAMNRLDTEVPLRHPKRISGRDGGIMVPSVPPTAWTEAAKGTG